MTYHAPDIDSSGDRPALEGGAEASPELEITDEMIAAGADELAAHYLDIRDARSGAKERAAEAIFRAMAALQTR